MICIKLAKLCGQLASYVLSHICNGVFRNYCTYLLWISAVAWHLMRTGLIEHYFSLKICVTRRLALCVYGVDQVLLYSYDYFGLGLWVASCFMCVLGMHTKCMIFII